MQLEIWSDVACPWCAIGLSRLELAVDGFSHRDELEIRWRSFELDPRALARVEGGYAERLAAKYGTDRARAQGMIDQMTRTAADDGWNFDFDRIVPGNTFAAHRLLHLAADQGIQHEVKRRFLRGYLEDGVAIGDPTELARLAVGAGLDAAAVAEVLDGDAYADAVRGDEQQARTFGIGGVPFFVIDRRYAIEGAQPAEVIRGALDRAFAERGELQVVGATRSAATRSAAEPHASPHDHAADHDHAGDHACADGSCAV